MMLKPWEIFYAAWEQRAASAFPFPSTTETEQMEHWVADAIREAGRETAQHLRHDLEWSLIHSHLLTGRFIQIAEEWVSLGAPDAGELRSRLRAAWYAEQTIYAVEEERRRITEDVLAGAASGMWGSGAAGFPGAGEEQVFELYTW
jgi:hypothetical protein